MLDDRTCPSPLHAALRWGLCFPLLALVVACTSPREHRAGIDEIQSQWGVDEAQRQGSEQLVAEDSLEELVEHLHALGDSGQNEPTALASIVKLARVAGSNPSNFVRAEALDSAWKLAASRPALVLREDDIDSTAFSTTTRRYEELIADPLRRDGAESLALIASIGATRFPVSQLRLGLDLADLVVSQSLWGATPALRAAFAENAESSALHALTCATLTAAAERDAFLRQTAVRHAAKLHIDLALNLVGNAFDRDPETLVALEAMRQLEQIAQRATPEQLEVLLALARRRDEPSLSARVTAFEERRAAQPRDAVSADLP